MKTETLLRTAFVLALAVALNVAQPLFAGTLRNDFNGDGKSDLIWRHQLTGDLAMWEMDGRTILGGDVFFSVPDFNYQIQGFGDFDGDGYDDILWRNSVTLELAVWILQGPSLLNGSPLAVRPGADWEVAGFGDFNGDFYDDILWWNGQTNEVAMWEMNGHEIRDDGVFYTVSGEGWRIAGVADFNGDGLDDILWLDDEDPQDLHGRIAIWHMNGRTILSGGVVSGAGGWDEVIAGTGDFDGDGLADIVSRDSRDGMVRIWYGPNFQDTTRRIRQWPADYRWNIEQIGDFDGNGQDEIIWWNSANTDVAMWELCQMSAPILGHCTESDGGIIFRVWDPDWSIEPPGAIGTPRPEDALHWRVTSEIVSGALSAEGCIACSASTTHCLRPDTPSTPVRLRVTLENTGPHIPFFEIAFTGPGVQLVSATPAPPPRPGDPGCYGNACDYMPLGENNVVEFIVDVTPPAGGFTGQQVMSVVTQGNRKPSSRPGGDACFVFDPTR